MSLRELFKNRRTSEINGQHNSLIVLTAAQCKFSTVSFVILHTGTVIFFFTRFRIWCISLSGQIFQNDWKCQCPKAPKKKKKSSSVKCLIESDLLKSWILLCSFSLTKKKAGGVPGKMRIFAQQCYSIRNHRWNLVALDLSFSMQIPQKCFSGPFCAPIHSQFNWRQVQFSWCGPVLAF